MSLLLPPADVLVHAENAEVLVVSVDLLVLTALAAKTFCAEAALLPFPGGALTCDHADV